VPNVPHSSPPRGWRRETNVLNLQRCGSSFPYAGFVACLLGQNASPEFGSNLHTATAQRHFQKLIIQLDGAK
jgi:hypothetical protein